MRRIFLVPANAGTGSAEGNLFLFDCFEHEPEIVRVRFESGAELAKNLSAHFESWLFVPVLHLYHPYAR